MFKIEHVFDVTNLKLQSLKGSDYTIFMKIWKMI